MKSLLFSIYLMFLIAPISFSAPVTSQASGDGCPPRGRPLNRICCLLNVFGPNDPNCQHSKINIQEISSSELNQALQTNTLKLSSEQKTKIKAELSKRVRK